VGVAVPWIPLPALPSRAKSPRYPAKEIVSTANEACPPATFTRVAILHHLASGTGDRDFMTFDPVDRIVYAAHWDAGLWALVVP
jgi:hypothetical protein